MTKQELREIYKTKRAALGSKDRLKLDDLMLLQFQQLNYEGIQTILTYWPMPNQAEPNTHLFSGYLRHMISGLQIAYPVSNTSTHAIKAIIIDEETIYNTNEWGITEPKEGVPVAATQIDLVLVPLLIFDEQGYRVGYGKGFYDRYLSQCRKDVIKIGLSYFEPVNRISDTSQFDVPLSFCITPQHIYEF